MSNSRNEIFNTQDCKSYQCDQSNAFYIDLFGEETRFDVCSLISFHQKVKDINLESLLLDVNSSSIEIIHLACIDRLFVFDVEELIQVKDLLQGTFAMIQLNTEIHSRLKRNILI